MAVIPFRTAYDGKRVNTSDVDFTDTESMTEQCHKNDCDINTIIRKYDKTGLITHVNQAVARYGDFTLVNEYQENLQMVINAQVAFDELPAHIRKKFGNDPGAFFEFATDPSNLDKMIEFGLANKPVIEQVVAPVVEPTPTA